METLASRRFWTAGLAALAVVLTTVAGFCLFDTDGHNHDGVGRDLCTTILAVPFGPAVLVVLGLVGPTAQRLGWAATPVTVSIPHLPPWR